ncbi:hypothetical protein [Mycobacteroides abscessus]|uniref:hypothetical protein n=1 Tax=Mycobacteroides abscessus TaxID=36809 RepID=UPI00092777B1|nr:hypothetical protein [Mycobacteroides abscessus]SHV16160.1 Uncharacterised protein [Mycobacteroides abscessus subsp. abscessus]SHV36081.1 Uncharacterised protein [Mycobacteroides abscessus subsp. abscessus]SHV57873.1 Uncharacterised protein [Mycobacteroides abscessus subsp. abscessus]SHW25004.1 Uncharacterised protein [Mycobacteroides abscessus subsp. abscessus]SHW62329.1 Uncharacterised protein [Mycobacteroides abscessus subsp. abscessus]
MKWDSFMTDDERNETKRRGTPVLLIMFGLLFALIGFSVGGGGIWLGLFGLFAIGIAVLKIVQDGKKRAAAKTKAAEDAELRAYQLRQARGQQ